ncbi:MAG: hypothetical protein HKM89_10650 [Gemmatimonadales bacterium]|nr:hypothetical protein [Gemmatimonadales bacterium]
MPSKREPRVAVVATRVALWAGALFAFWWALAAPLLRDAEGALTTTALLPIAVAASLSVVAATWAGQYKKAGLWVAVGLLGQAVALQFVRAGTNVAYQHLGSSPPLPELRGPLLGWLAVQTALVLSALYHRWTGIGRWVTRHFRVWQVLVIGALFVLSSATLSRSVLAYGGELLFATFLQTLNLATIIVAVWAIPESALSSGGMARLCRLGLDSESATVERLRTDRFAILAAAWTLALSLTLAIVSYERHPHIPDEVGYLIQAGYFAKGMLWLPLPPVPEAVSVEMLFFGADKVYSILPPGWPAALTLGVLIGAPWIINPLFAALNVLMVYLLLQELYDRRLARLGVLLLVCSPWSIFLAMSFMTHTFTLTCALVAALGIVATRRSGRAVWACLAGGAIGVTSLVRPLDALVVAGLMGLWSLGLGGKRLSFRAIFGMVAVAITVGLGNLPYNRLLTGEATTFPIMQYFTAYYGPKANALGFGPERGFGWTGLDPFPGHGLIDVLVNSNLNLFATNIELLGWSCGSLLLAFLAVFSMRMRQSDRVLVASGLAVIGIHTLYWFSGGPDFGARYWYLILVPCIGLTARGAMILADLLSAQSSHNRVTLGILSLCFLAIVTFVPWRAIDKYHHYRGMRPDIRSLARETDFGRSLVLIQGAKWPDYHSAAAYNPPDWNANQPLYVWDRDPEVRDSILRRYPDRQIWVVAGPSVTGGPFRLLRGPIPASDLR